MCNLTFTWTQCDSVVKNPPTSAGDMDSIPGSGRSPGGGHGNHSSSLAWRIPWTEEPGGLKSMGSQEFIHNLATKPPPPIYNTYNEQMI